VTAASRDFVRMHDYIVGRLSDDERQAFENRLVRDPQLVREIERSLRMREGLQQLRARGYFAGAGAEATGVATRGSSFRLWLPALAAAVVAALALFLWVQREAPASPVLTASLESRSGAVAPSVTAHFTFVAVRGSSTPDLALPSSGVIEIRAAPATRLTSRYRMTLIRRDAEGSAESIGALADLALSSDGYVHCFADASRLAAGSYLLRLEPDTTTSGVAQVFRFSLGAGANRPTP
jgi:hypothetical protein